ncbi:hypothetical protein DY000_02007683 [Brassica cretica]|uniref:Uncharacterized protein n=1 Tax=Brassica cretica TaxID=69181 RepID=A0ABQ7CIX7_BRACR|nr:hypothetical protein DY000_02007683 [Brassica cretica]
MTPMRPRLHRGYREPRGSSLDFMRSTRNRTVLHLPRQDYYRYLFGFRILPLGSWPLSSSYAVFCFCRKSLTGLEGGGVGVMTQVPRLRCFPRLEKQARSVLIHVLFHIGTLGIPMRLRLHRGFRIGGLRRPDPARMPL